MFMHVVQWIGLAIWVIAVLCWLFLEVLYAHNSSWWQAIARSALAFVGAILVSIGALVTTVLVLAPLLHLFPPGFLSNTLAAIGLSHLQRCSSPATPFRRRRGFSFAGSCARCCTMRSTPHPAGAASQ
ncbi:hypothetical protein HY632_04260 [Candidatus Uhrbacteria bacterium]|nr:hypothetical protein [Candidatus Uhrbacteria bacterium]